MIDDGNGEAPEECPTCTALFAVEDGRVFRYRCPRCRRVGCDVCMPAGNGCMCPECEGDEEMADAS